MARRVFLVLALSSLTACQALKNIVSPSEPLPNEVLYSAIGASDAVGYGGSVPCLPLTDCPDGTGYVPVVARRLQHDGKTVTVLNLGIPGAVLSPQTQALGNSIGLEIYGNFLDQEGPFIQKNSTLVTVFTGANDANTIGQVIEAGRADPDANTFVQNQTTQFGQDVRTLLGFIKARASSARIAFFNLPNLAGLPYAKGYDLDKKKMLQKIAVGFSAQINALTAEGVIVIDLMCDSRFYQAGSFSADGFHPNDTGYSYLADLLYNAAVGGSVAAPKSSCSQMSIY